MTSRARLAIVAAAATSAIVVAALTWFSQRGEGPIGVVVITLDTTRADRLSPYGFVDVSLPALERLAREGAVFNQATSVAPLTLPAHTSLFTGLLPPNHGVRDNADSPLADSHTTLAEVLTARGFKTAAFVGSVVLGRNRGLAQGFDRYDAVPDGDRGTAATRQRPANVVIDDAIRWLDTVGESRFFLWTHLFDAHRPYSPPEPYLSKYAHNPYIGEIAFADSQVGRLLDALERRGLLNRTVVIVTADHGESLGAHGERDHGIFVYEDVLRVPLMVRAPGIPPARIDEVVRLTDIMPTVLDWFGGPIPPIDGVSLVGLMTGRHRDLNLEAYSESLYPRRLGWSPLRALRDSRFKLIDAPRPELYDLMNDPFEERNIYDERASLAQEMRARLGVLARDRVSSSGTAATASRDLQARLSSLGYVASPTAPASSDSTAPDPKDCIGTYIGTALPSTARADCGHWRVIDDVSPGVPTKRQR